MQGEDEKASTLRGYFAQGSQRGSGEVTVRTIGKRLSKILGAPVWVDGQTLKLVRRGDEHGHAAWFEVKVIVATPT